MADLVDLLQEYLLIPRKVEENERESCREDIQKTFKDLESYLLDEETWNIFLEVQYDVTNLKVKLNSKTDQERAEIFKFGIACLVAFTQVNFTKPDPSDKVRAFLKGDAFQLINFPKMLSYNNEEINCLTEFPQLLVTAKIIFEWCIVNSVVNIWWYWRALYLHQQCLEELCPSLLSDADRLYKLLQINPTLKDNIKIALDIEVAQLYLLFRHVSKAKEHINSATDLLNLKYDYIGVLGKRTKYQEKEISQLALKVNINEEKTQNTNSNERTNGNIESTTQHYDFDIALNTDDSVLPKNLPLNDDVRLDNVAYTNSINGEIVLSNSAQKLFLTIVQEMLIAKPPDELQTEELLPFIELVLSHKNTFCVRVVALLLRCKSESKNRRTIERALRQCEEVINSFRNEQLQLCDRFNDVFSTGLPPLWKVTTQYADLLLNVGLPKNALDVYLKLELWEEVIVCYTILKLRHKAAEIIKKQLDKKPTVKLWCLLGDATDDITCYETAWDLSKRRSHRAQRHWGNYLFNRKRYENCIPHFEKSVSINPLQANVWFRLGYAAHQTQNWQVAATAYKRYTTLEPDGFEAWNNLAQAYLKIGNKRSAHQALLEALKCNYENWKVWENFLLVSSDISMYSDVIRSYHRLLDLKEKFLNTHVLAELVCDVIDDTIDSEGLPAARFLQKTRELLGRVVTLFPGEPPLWELYAKLAPSTILKAQRFQRAYKAYVKDNQWANHLSTCHQVLYVCFELSDIALLSEVDPKNALLNSVKLNIGSAIAAIRKQNFEETKESLEKLTARLELIVEKIKSGDVK
ncbi:tetratricopeptide repeat protein 27 isoform X2 [Sitophilus oryzae]|uniref:Tetratricopeptide repeat protein 27 isoform X2 n=1 Tax=Sitophilus oryzae TaxID=7048 RepID=A0A6J2YPQ6_SITOR|nr:tetratricopeptide repeat protein 27 isoform X2 [Sitophilus oryzae]